MSDLSHSHDDLVLVPEDLSHTSFLTVDDRSTYFPFPVKPVFVAAHVSGLRSATLSTPLTLTTSNRRTGFGVNTPSLHSLILRYSVGPSDPGLVLFGTYHLSMKFQIPPFMDIQCKVTVLLDHCLVPSLCRSVTNDVRPFISRTSSFVTVFP